MKYEPPYRPDGPEIYGELNNRENKQVIAADVTVNGIVSGELKQ